MAPGFVFNPVTDTIYNSTIQASELLTANGYTQGGVTLSNPSPNSDNVNVVSYVQWSAVSWTVNTSNISTVGAIIYDTSLPVGYTNAILGYIDFGQTITTQPGGTMTVLNPAIAVAFGTISEF
jgi:hypothetical protein